MKKSNFKIKMKMLMKMKIMEAEKKFFKVFSKINQIMKNYKKKDFSKKF